MSYQICSENRKSLEIILKKNREVINRIEKFKFITLLKNEVGQLVVNVDIFDNALKELLLLNYKITKMLKETPKTEHQVFYSGLENM